MLFHNPEDNDANESNAKLHYNFLRDRLKVGSFSEHFYNLNIIFKENFSLYTNKLIFILMFPNLEYCQELHTQKMPSFIMPDYSYEEFLVKFDHVFGEDNQEETVQNVSFEMLDNRDDLDDMNSEEKFEVVNNIAQVEIVSDQSNSWVRSNLEAIKSEDVKSDRVFQCKNCGVPYVSKSRMLKHMQFCQEKNQKYNKILVNNDGDKIKIIEILDQEIETTHLDEKCGSCGKTFSSESVAIRHEIEICQNLGRIHRIKHPIFSCSMCNKYLMGTSFLKYHLHHVHGSLEKHELRNDIEDNISVVGEVLSSDEIMKIVRYGQTEQCATCKKRFSTYIDMKKHIEDNHPKYDNKKMCSETGIKYWVCKICFTMFEDQKSYNAHTDNHPNYPGFENLESCIRKTSNAIMMDEKIAFICPICSDSFEESLEFNRHLELHKNEKENLNFKIANQTILIKDTNSNLTCDFCGKTFQSRDCLITHEVEIHGDVKKFARMGGSRDRIVRKCKYCPKLFLHPSKLNDHARIHTGELSFQCSKCDETFSTKKSVIKHEMAVHGIDSDVNYHKKAAKKQANNHICTYCPKAFSAPAFLLQHERTHTKERPFKCSVCEKTFGTKSNMTTHSKTHQKEKKLPCNMCEYKTNNKRYLKTHVQTHTETINHTCPGCGDAFKTYQNMWKHKRICTSNKFQPIEDDKKDDDNENPTLIAIEAYDDTEPLLHADCNNAVNDAVKTIFLTDNLEMDSRVVNMEVVKDNLQNNDKNTGEIFVQEDGIIYETVLFDQ